MPPLLPPPPEPPPDPPLPPFLHFLHLLFPEDLLLLRSMIIAASAALSALLLRDFFSTLKPSGLSPPERPPDPDPPAPSGKLFVTSHALRPRFAFVASRTACRTAFFSSFSTPFMAFLISRFTFFFKAPSCLPC